MEVTGSFVALLEVLRPVFTEPSYQTFVLLMSGWILSQRHRYVTDLIVSSDSVGNGHFSDYHRFFSHAAWDIQELWRLVAQLAFTLVGPGATILLVADDTLCRKRGLGLFGAGMHHDPLISSRAKKLVSWGHDWVILAVVIVNPAWAPGTVFALPINARLYRNRQGLTKGQKKEARASRATSQKTQGTGKTARKATKKAARKTRRQAARRSRAAKRSPAKTTPKTPLKTPHRTRPDLLAEMLVQVAGWFPDRQFALMVDSLYSGASVLLKLPKNVDLIGPVHPKGNLYAVPEPQTGRGRRRKKGALLSGLKAWASDDTKWQRLPFDQYGLHTTLEIKTRQGLYYAAGKDRELQFILARDTEGQRPTRIFYCTNLTLAAREVLSWYAYRWSCEVTHHDVKQHLGFEDPANRLPMAVQRTAPMALVLYSLTVVWYAREGHRQVRFPVRPWYERKRDASFADMLTTLRRVTWEEKFAGVQPASRGWKKPLRLLTYLATLAG